MSLELCDKGLKKWSLSKRRRIFFAVGVKCLLNFLNRKEVIKMADKKSRCGCGGIPLKQNSTKTTKEKKAKKSK